MVSPRDPERTTSVDDPFLDAPPVLRGVLIARFLLELALLAGLVVLAWHLASGGWRWVAAMLAVIAVATLWGLFLSPRAPLGLPVVAAVALETALFLGTGTGLLLIGLGAPAAIGVAAWAVHRIALSLLRR